MFILLNSKPRLDVCTFYLLYPEGECMKSRRNDRSTKLSPRSLGRAMIGGSQEREIKFLTLVTYISTEVMSHTFQDVIALAVFLVHLVKIYYR